MATAAEAAAHFDAFKTKFDELVQLLREIAAVLRSGPSDGPANDALIAKIDGAVAEADQVLADTKDVDPTP